MHYTLKVTKKIEKDASGKKDRNRDSKG